VSDQQARYRDFRALHAADRAFVVGNPWDAGSAGILAAMGFQALATTSAGHAFTVGRRDSSAGPGRDEILANAAAIVGACDLPVTADLGTGPAAPRKLARGRWRWPAISASSADRSRMRRATPTGRFSNIRPWWSELSQLRGRYAIGPSWLTARTAEEVLIQGTFSCAEDAIPDREVSRMMTATRLVDRTASSR